MNILTRIRQIFVPAPAECGHEMELHQLRNEVMAARLARRVAERNFGEREADLAQKLGRLRDERERLAAREKELHAAIAVAFHEVSENPLWFGHTPAMNVVERAGSRLQGAIARELDLVAQIEELNSRIAILQQPNRSLFAGDRQSSAATDDVPSQDDEIVSDRVYELAYRLVGGIWFEGKHHWVLGRGEERVKAPIHDKDFLERMKRGEVTFVAGDTLLADFRVVTYRSAEGEVYAAHSVEKVKRVIHPDEQLALAGTEAEVGHA